MYLRQLYIRNFMLIREADLTFGADNRVIGIVARYDDPTHDGRSNRGGKTTFVNAIEYLLYGECRKASPVSLINRAACEAGEGMKLVGVLVFDDDSEVTITRERNSKGDPSVEISGREGLGWKDANEAMESLIGFTHKEWKNTANFSQGQIHTFMQSEPREKRKLLLGWLNQERWEVRRKFAKDEADKCDRKVEALSTALTALPEPEDDPEHLKDLLEDARDEVVDMDARLIEMNQRRATLVTEEKAALENEKVSIEKARLNAESVRLEAELEVAEANVVVAAGLNVDLRALHKQWDIDRVTLTEAHTEAHSRADVAKQRVLQLVIRLEAVRDTGGVCPVLGEGCDRIGQEAGQSVDDDIVVSRAVAATTEDERDSAKGVLTRARTTHRAAAKVLEDKVDELGSLDVSFFQSELARIDDKLEVLAGQVVKDLRSSDEVNADIEVLDVKREPHTEQLGQWREKLRGYEDAIRRVTEYTERKAKLERDLTGHRGMAAAWAYCIYMFGNRGIPAEHIKAAFESLETDVNYILGRLNSGLTIEFKPYRHSKSKEKYCLACGSEFKPRQRKCQECGEDRQPKLVEQLVLNIHDTMEGQQSDFELDSGGGKVLISFAVRLALLFLKVRSNHGEVPPIILDEIIGMLDPVNRQSIINIVVNILTQEYNVKQVFWISHSEEILDLLENALVVTRFDDHSVVNWM